MLKASFCSFFGMIVVLIIINRHYIINHRFGPINTEIMKSFSLNKILLVFFILCGLVVKSQDITVFEINASALFNDKPTENYTILVYEDGKLVDSLFMKKVKPTKIKLEGEKLYSIVFKKENYTPKFVIVDTKVPKGIGEILDEPFDLQIELSPEINKIKKEFDDYPVAVLNVNKKKRLLMASENYYQLTRN